MRNGRKGLTLLLLALLIGSTGCNRSTRSVIVYTSQDQVFAEPILHRFTRETGIRVEAVFDSEAVKTVGLANRLIAETNHPKCDVWWSNEELRTRQLAQRGVFAGSNSFVSLGFRSRRVVVNTNALPLAKAPQSVADLTNSQWRGKIALAYPLFGTTTAHFLALRELWGPRAWESWCRALSENKPFVVEGNSSVVKLVSRGDAWLGLTDSDDVLVAQRQRAPVTALPLTAECLLIPNTLAVVRGSTHPTEAEALISFLRSPEVANSLIGAGGIEATNIGSRPHLSPAWPAILSSMDESTAILKEIFVR